MTKETMRKVRNWLNVDITDSTCEAPNTLPSMTVPDLSMSVKEIIDRANMGLPPEGERVPIYDEGNDMPDISHMDLADRQRYIEYYRKELEETNERIEAFKNANERLKNEREEQKVLEEAYKDNLLDDKH